MASIGGSGARQPNGKKNLDAEINLVPFIDLLSVCICFLLITAVWIQVGTLQVKQSHGVEGVVQDKKKYEFELRFMDSNSIEWLVQREGRTIQNVKVKEQSTELLIDKLDKKLSTWLKSAGVNAQNDITSAMITPKKNVSYGNLVSVLDLLRKYQIINLGVVPVKDSI